MCTMSDGSVFFVGGYRTSGDSTGKQIRLYTLRNNTVTETNAGTVTIQPVFAETFSYIIEAAQSGSGKKEEFVVIINDSTNYGPSSATKHNEILQYNAATQKFTSLGTKLYTRLTSSNTVVGTTIIGTDGLNYIVFAPTIALTDNIYDNNVTSIQYVCYKRGKWSTDYIINNINLKLYNLQVQKVTDNNGYEYAVFVGYGNMPEYN